LKNHRAASASLRATPRPSANTIPRLLCAIARPWAVAVRHPPTAVLLLVLCKRTPRNPASLHSPINHHLPHGGLFVLFFGGRWQRGATQGARVLQLKFTQLHHARGVKHVSARQSCSRRQSNRVQAVGKSSPSDAASLQSANGARGCGIRPALAMRQALYIMAFQSNRWQSLLQ
jgi:hypothetical protein